MGTKENIKSNSQLQTLKNRNLLFCSPDPTTNSETANPEYTRNFNNNKERRKKVF